MRYLLDTHVWLWGLVEPERMKAATRRRIEDGANELWLSPISVWELGLLADRGRVELDAEAGAWARDALASSGVREATLNHEVALESRLVRLPHPDPADRFLAATARVYELTLVTADRRLLEARACRTLSAR